MLCDISYARQTDNMWMWMERLVAESTVAVADRWYARVVNVLNAWMISDAERTVTQWLAESVDGLRVRLVSGVNVQRVSCTPVHSSHIHTHASLLWHCWLGHLTRKNPSPYDLYCVGGTLSLTQSINHTLRYKGWDKDGQNQVASLGELTSLGKKGYSVAHSRLLFLPSL